MPELALWDMTEPSAQEQLNRVKLTWPQVITMVQLLHLKDNHIVYDEIFKHYFADDEKSGVAEVWRLVLGASGPDDQGNKTGNPIFSSRISFVNFSEEFNDPCRDQNQLAYLTSETDLNGHYRLADLSESIRHGLSIDRRDIMRQLRHFDRIGISATGGHIQDFGTEGYGPKNTREVHTFKNADSYRWMAQEYYWSIKCNRTFKAPDSNKDSTDCDDTHGMTQYLGTSN
ncbi:Fc.00g109180.m01.CDS01 [Cosmosporella sp. VM-42]